MKREKSLAILRRKIKMAQTMSEEEAKRIKIAFEEKYGKENFRKSFEQIKK